jgi:hypothetical protein
MAAYLSTMAPPLAQIRGAATPTWLMTFLNGHVEAPYSSDRVRMWERTSLALNIKGSGRCTLQNHEVEQAALEDTTAVPR